MHDGDGDDDGRRARWRPVGCSNCDAPVKKASAAGTGRAPRWTSARCRSTKSFQAMKNAMIAVVKTPGAASGTMTLRNACQRGGPVHLRGLLHLPGDLPEERRQRPDARSAASATGRG